MRDVLYGELVGSLNWLASNTRPDIATAVGSLCRFIVNPGQQHWSAARRVLQYLSCTSTLRLCYSKKSDADPLTGYSDSDCAGDPDSRRSTTGFVFLLAGGAVSWKSQLQSSTSLSSVEAEYVALCSAAREAVWMRQLLSDVGHAQHAPTRICADNRGCIAIANHNRSDSRTKHIDVKYHYTREQIKEKRIDLTHVPTGDMVADSLTKPINVAKFKWCRERMALKPSLPVGSRGHVEVAADCNSAVRTHFYSANRQRAWGAPRPHNAFLYLECRK